MTTTPKNGTADDGDDDLASPPPETVKAFIQAEAKRIDEEMRRLAGQITMTTTPNNGTAETPRTDLECSDGWSGDAICVSADFARQLETELAVANALVAEVSASQRNWIAKCAAESVALGEANAELARLRVSEKEARQAEEGCRQIIDTYVDETECLHAHIAKLTAPARGIPSVPDMAELPRKDVRYLFAGAVEQLPGTDRDASRKPDETSASATPVHGFYLCEKGHGWMVNGQPCYLCQHARIGELAKKCDEQFLKLAKLTAPATASEVERAVGATSDLARAASCAAPASPTDGELEAFCAAFYKDATELNPPWAQIPNDEAEEFRQSVRAGFAAMKGQS